MPEELFENADEYDEMLQRGLALSGENKAYFIDQRVTRLRRLLRDTPRLLRDTPVDTVLDFGCGVGDASGVLADAFKARVVGVDIAEGAVEKARRTHVDPRLSFGTLDELDRSERFDLAYVNGAFHHIPVDQRAEAVRQLHRGLKPGGVLAVFENNPYSPAARLVMRRIEFDRGAVMVWPRAMARLLAQGGFEIIAPPRYLFVFPRALAPLRRIEPRLERLAIGAQYLTLARRT